MPKTTTSRKGCIFVSDKIYSFGKGIYKWNFTSHVVDSSFSGICISRDVIIAPKSGDTLYFINQTSGMTYDSNIYQASSLFVPIIDANALELNEKVVAIGEIGLDYYWDEPERSIQKKWFARQIALARKVRLPVIIHSREAAADTLDILTSEKASDTGGILHCFSYGIEMASKFIDMGFYIGVGGVVTFKNGRKLKEVVDHIPLERIVTETDSPYMAPVPMRGKRNSSEYLPYIISQIAEIKKVSVEEVTEITYQNAVKIFGR